MEKMTSSDMKMCTEENVFTNRRGKVMNVAFIPVRGGSKSIPLKNIREIAGHPLVYWVVKAACECPCLDRVFVSTDHEGIKKTVESFGFGKLAVCGRSPQTASDYASTESAMLEFAQKQEFDNIVLIQATSPLLTSSDLERGFKTFAMPDTDSVLSVVRQKRFFWKETEGFVVPDNYDVYHRPMRQNFEGCLVENGAFYITSKKQLLASRNRVSGNIRAVEMPEETYYEIDEVSDWKIIESIMAERKEVQPKSTIPDIKMFLTDCDGCLTDGGMYFTQQGEEIKKFHTYDGMGFQLLREKGIITGIITGESNPLVECRAKKIQADILKMGVRDKLPVVKKICDTYGISMEHVAYVGDDMNDYEVIKAVGFGCSVKNASDMIKSVSKYTAKKQGGDGAVREIIDYILSAGNISNENKQETA